LAASYFQVYVKLMSVPVSSVESCSRETVLTSFVRLASMSLPQAPGSAFEKGPMMPICRPVMSGVPQMSDTAPDTRSWPGCWEASTLMLRGERASVILEGQEPPNTTLPPLPFSETYIIIVSVSPADMSKVTPAAVPLNSLGVEESLWLLVVKEEPRRAPLVPM
jgi:hypothetical protein